MASTPGCVTEQCSDAVLQRGPALPCTPAQGSLSLYPLSHSQIWIHQSHGCFTTSAKPALNSSLQQHNVAWHNCIVVLHSCAIVKACQQFHYWVLFLAVCNFKKNNNKSIYSAGLIWTVFFLSGKCNDIHSLCVWQYKQFLHLHKKSADLCFLIFFLWFTVILKWILINLQFIAKLS